MNLRDSVLVAVFSMSVFMGSCTAPKAAYLDPGSQEALTADFGSTDLQLIAEKMVASLMESDRLKSDPTEPDKPPVVAIAWLKNKTSEHIDTKSIMDKIRTTLIKTGRVRFSAMDMQGDIVGQVQFQDIAANTETQKHYGKQVGAKYILGGDITSIVKQSGRVKDVYYKITLNLVDIESGLIDWAEEKEIRKDSVRPLFGR
jgi:uncharacterized protein (TIGR02722 family)